MESPEGLRAAGRRLWSGIDGSRVIDDTNYAQVLNACRIADRLDDIALELSLSPLTCENAKGDIVAQPLIVEHRMQAATLKQILAGLGFTNMQAAKRDKMSLQEKIAAAREQMAGGE